MVSQFHGHLGKDGFTLGTKTQARGPDKVLVLTYYFFSLHVQVQISMGSDKKKKSSL